MLHRLLRRVAVPLLLLLVLVSWLLYQAYASASGLQLWQLQGQTMGTISYHIRYRATQPQLNQPRVDSLLTAFNNVFSTYVPDSEISRFNDGDTLVFGSALWVDLLSESRWAYLQSKGAFDPTVGPLVEAWGFGTSGQPTSDTSRIEELLNYVGFDKLYISETALSKSDARLRLDMSAIAKGYAVDLVAGQLSATQLEDYMVEIGGEVYVSGQRSEGEPWRIGIQDPLRPTENAAAAVLKIPKGGIATSGNYRNRRQIGQRTYAHTLNPQIGRPVVHSLLSATVWATNCSRADALATACLVVGLREAVDLILRTPTTEALFFYTDSTATVRSYLTDGIRAYVSALRYQPLPQLPEQHPQLP